MSWMGFGRPQPSSAEKIAAAETELDMVSDMFNRSVAVKYVTNGDDADILVD